MKNFYLQNVDTCFQPSLLSGYKRGILLSIYSLNEVHLYLEDIK